jgi:hypothetical protein
MGLTLSFGIGPLRASIPLTSRRRRSKRRRSSSVSRSYRRSLTYHGTLRMPDSRALAVGPPPPAPQPRATPATGNWAASPDDAGTDEPLGDDEHQDPDTILRRALSAAPAEGVPVSDLITITGMSRRWVFYRLSQLAADGYAVQTVRGYWRTARLLSVTGSAKCKCTPSRASARIAASSARALALSPNPASSPDVITEPPGRDPSGGGIMSDHLTPMTGEQVANNPHDGRLSPLADPVTGTPGWRITTLSRSLAMAVATLTSGTVHPHEKGEWQARIPQAILMVVVIDADDGALWCRLSAQQHSGVFVQVFAPLPTATVLKCSVTVLPTHGQLSARDVRVITRMGRTVRYLVPTFTTP